MYEDTIPRARARAGSDENMEAILHWAFGDNAGQTALNDAPGIWGSRHPRLWVISSTDEVDDTMLRIVDHWMTVWETLNGEHRIMDALGRQLYRCLECSECVEDLHIGTALCPSCRTTVAGRGTLIPPTNPLRAGAAHLWEVAGRRVTQWTTGDPIPAPIEDPDDDEELPERVEPDEDREVPVDPTPDWGTWTVNIRTTPTGIRYYDIRNTVRGVVLQLCEGNVYHSSNLQARALGGVVLITDQQGSHSRSISITGVEVPAPVNTDVFNWLS